MTTRVVGDVAVRVGADVGPLGIGLQKAGRDVDRFGRRSQGMARKLRGAATLAATAIAGMATAIAASAGRAISSMDSIGKKADQIGIAVEAFQELEFAAKSAGVSNSAFTSSLERFSKRLGEAVNGTGAAKTALENLGISAEKLADLGVEEAFMVIVDELDQMESATERAAAAAALFGREGVAMVNMARGGADALRQTREEARKMGAVIGEDTVRQAEALEDELGRLKDVIGAQLSEALIAIGPVLTTFMGWVADAAKAINRFASQIMGFANSAIEAYDKVVNHISSGGGGGGAANRRSRGPLANMGPQQGPQQDALAALGGDAPGDPGGGRNPAAGLLPVGGATAIFSTGTDTGGGGGTPDLSLDDDGTGGGGGGRSVLDALVPSEEEIERMMERFKTARELIEEEYNTQLEMLDKFYADKEGKDAEYAERRKQIEEEMQAKLAELRNAEISHALGTASTLFEGMAKISKSGSERMLQIAKAFGAAEALVSTMQGAAKALNMPFPANIAAAASVVAQGMSFIAAIRGANPGGGGGGGVAAFGGGGFAGRQRAGSVESSGEESPKMERSLTLLGERFSRMQAIQIAEFMNEGTDDGLVIRGN